MTRYLAIAALLTACGGGGDTEFGWWNGKGTSGSLSIAEPSEYKAALARGQKPIVIVWTTVQRPDGSLTPGWRDSLQAVIDATPEAIGYYAFDEPNLQGVSQADQAAVIEALPPKMVMVSLSTPELGKPVHPRVNMLGLNLYSSAGVTPDQAKPYLDRLAEYKRPMYLNLDAVWVTDRGASCANVPVTAQKASIALNDAILEWGRGIAMRVAFLWQSGDDGTNQICGASDMPLVRTYLESL